MITHDDYLLGYNYFKNYYKMIVIDLSKQQALNADLKSIQQIDFTGNLENNAIIFFIIFYYYFSLRSKRNSFRFSTRNCKCILILFFLEYKMTQYNTLTVKLSNS